MKERIAKVGMKPDNIARNEEIYQLRKKGASISVIADRFGLSQSTVAVICKKLKKKEEIEQNEPADSILKSSLSTRTKNTLYRSGITTTAQLEQVVKGGNTSINEIRGLGMAAQRECMLLFGIEEDSPNKEKGKTTWKIQFGQEEAMEITANVMAKNEEKRFTFDGVEIQFLTPQNPTLKINEGSL